MFSDTALANDDEMLALAKMLSHSFVNWLKLEVNLFQQLYKLFLVMPSG